MSAALVAAPAPRTHAARVLVVGSSPRVVDAAELPSFFRPGDLLVVNDAATLPASLAGASHGVPVELRLLRARGRDWDGVLFGRGSWRDRTEDREAPPPLQRGDMLRLGPLRATVLRVHRWSPRLLRVRFDLEGAASWSALFAWGRPVQYSYLRRPVALDEAQTPYATRPWAVEAPSAGFVLDAALRDRLTAAGARIASLTHAAGLSATGDEALDARLPLPERYEIPQETVDAVRAAQRVIAVGTTVVRALESAARCGLRAGAGIARLRIGPGTRLRVVDGLLSGVHEPGASHHELLRAFAPDEHLRAALTAAARHELQIHEFGDLMLVMR